MFHKKQQHLLKSSSTYILLTTKFTQMLFSFMASTRYLQSQNIRGFLSLSFSAIFQLFYKCNNFLSLYSCIRSASKHVFLPRLLIQSLLFPSLKVYIRYPIYIHNSVCIHDYTVVLNDNFASGLTPFAQIQTSTFKIMDSRRGDRALIIVYILL